jgi:hypothetical protein
MTEYLVGVGLGIDQLFFHDASAIDPGRMAPNTAICFAMLGTALLLLDCTAPAVWALE